MGYNDLALGTVSTAASSSRPSSPRGSASVYSTTTTSDGENAFMRDSKASDAGALTLRSEAWRELLGAARSGGLDDLA